MASSEVVVVEKNGVEITAAVGGEAAGTCERASGAEHGGAADEEGEIPTEGRSRRWNRAVLQDGIAKSGAGAYLHHLEARVIDNVEDEISAVDGNCPPPKRGAICVVINRVGRFRNGQRTRKGSSVIHVRCPTLNVSATIGLNLSNHGDGKCRDVGVNTGNIEYVVAGDSRIAECP